MKTCCICKMPMTGTLLQRRRAAKVHPRVKCREVALEDRIEDVVLNLMKAFPPHA